MKNYFCGHWGFNDTPEGHQGADGRRGRIREQLDVSASAGLYKGRFGGMFPKKSRRWPKRALMILLVKLHF